MTPKQHLIELLTSTQREWRAVMDDVDGPPDVRTARIARVAVTFTAAWYLGALIEHAPEEAVDACRRLRDIFEDGGSVGEFTWDLLHDLGVNPATIEAAA